MEYKCPKCSKVYQNLGTLKKHFKSHMPGFVKEPKVTEKPSDSNFSCDICRKIYKHKTSLWRHSQSHLNDSPVTYTCPGCSSSFFKYSTYYKHRNRCEKYKEINEKKRKFLSGKRWIETTEEYLSIYQHKCQMCDQRFAIREQLDDHVGHCADPFWTPELKDSDSQRAFSHQMKTETKKLEVMQRRKRLISDIAKKFGTKRNKKRKYQRKEDILYNKPNRVTKCKKVFPTTATRVRARLVLKRSQRICAKTGKWKQTKIKQLIQRTHRKLIKCNAVLQGDYCYKCNLCAITFKTVSAAVMHLKQKCSKIKRPLVCSACLKDFSSVTSFRFHQLCQSHKIYHGFYIIRYVTIICKDGLTGSYEKNVQGGFEAIDISVKKLQSFLPSKTKTDIEAHTKILAGNYESKCLCGEIFHDRARLVNHVKSSHGMIVAFQCTVCRQNNIFADFFDLFRHLQAKHNTIIIQRANFEQKFLMPKADSDSRKKDLSEQSELNSRHDIKLATTDAIAKQKVMSASVSSAFEKSKDQFKNRGKGCKSLKSYASEGQKQFVEKRNLTKDGKNAARTRNRMVHTELMEKYQMNSTTSRAKLILKKYKVLSEEKYKTSIKLGKDCLDKTNFAAVVGRKKKNIEAKVKCSHQTVFRYKCKLCRKVFTTSYSVVCHLAKVHKKYLVLECSACQKVFSGWVNVKLHQFMHKRPAEISILHTKQITSGLLQRHDLLKIDEETRKIQQGRVVSRCNVCGKMFQRIQTLARHVKTAHNMILGQRCKLCTQRLFFENFKDFSDHLKHIHKKVIISENDFEQICVIKVDVKGKFPQSDNVSKSAIESMQNNQENITGRQKRQIKRKFDSAFEYDCDMAVSTKSRRLDKTSVSTADHSYVAFSEVIIKDNFGRDVKALIKIEAGKAEAENQLVIDKYCCKYCGKDCRTELLLQRHINRLHREEFLREKEEMSKFKKNTNRKNECKIIDRNSVKKKTVTVPKSKRSVVRTITEEEKKIARRVCRRDVRVAVRDISKLITREGNAKVTTLNKDTVLPKQQEKHKKSKGESGFSKKQPQTSVRMINTDLKQDKKSNKIFWYCQHCDYYSVRLNNLNRHVARRHKDKAIPTLNGKANKKSLKACQQTGVSEKGQTNDAVVQKQSAHSSVRLDDEYNETDHLGNDDGHETNSCSGDSYQSDSDDTGNKEVSEDEFETSGIGIERKKLKTKKTPGKSNLVNKKANKNREDTGFDFCYICAIKDCYEFFKTKKSLLNHKREAHGKSIVYVCSICEKEYSMINSLKVHLNVSHLNRKVVALQIAETNLCTRERKATKILICTICGAVGEQKELNGHTCQPKKPTYYCPFCSLKEYSTDYEKMKDHIKQAHPGIREASIKVEMSQTTIERGSPSNRTSNRSIERAAEDQSTVAAQAEVVKSSSAEQKTTSGEDTADKVFDCHRCWKQFISESSLNIHLGHCKGPKLQSFVCGLCRSSYPRYQALKKHIMTHLEYEFKCPVCCREFPEQSDLDRHANTHSKHKPYTCSICGNGYCDEKACKRHIKEKHPDEFEKQNGNPVINKIEVKPEDGGVKDGGVKDEEVTDLDTSIEKPVGEAGPLLKHVKCVSNKQTKSKAGTGTSKMKAYDDTDRERMYWQCKYCEYKTLRSSNMKRHLNSHYDKVDMPVQLDKFKHKGVYKRSDLMGNKQEGNTEKPAEPNEDKIVENSGIGHEANSKTEATAERYDAEVNTSTGQESPKGIDMKGDVSDNRVEQDGDLYIPDDGDSSEGDSSGASDTETYGNKTIRGAIKKRGNRMRFRTQNPEEVWPDVTFMCTTENCNRFFQHRKRLQAHKKEAHNKNVVFVCIYCQKEYSVLRSFKVHIRYTHLDYRNVPLRIADTELYSKDNGPTEVIVCTHCGLARETEQGIEHMCQPRAPTYYCPFCKMKKSSSDVEEIRNHIKQAHPQNIGKGEKTGPSQTIIVDGLNPDTVASEGEVGSQNVTDSGQIPEADIEAAEIVSCYHCSQEFSSHFDRNIHEHIHTGQKLQQYVCGFCGNSYPRCSALKKHIQQHLEYAYKCHLCDREFQEQSDLDRHVNTHTGHRPYQCDICGNRYCDDRACKRHIKEKHPDVYFERFGEVQRLSVGENQSFFCEQCGLVLTTSQHLRLHMSRYHGHKRRLFTCSICPDKSFCTKQKLDRHMQVHKHETLLEAQVKDKQLGSLQVEPDPKLKLHEKVSVLVKDPDALKAVYQQLRIHDKHHSSGLLNRCRICSKRFKSVKNLNLHIRRNHVSDENKKFRCTECGKGFTLRNSLKNHVRVHTNSRPYCCRLCQKTFKQIGHVKDHLLTHSSKFFNTCRLCGKQFKMNGSIKPHILTHCKLKPFKCPMCTDTFQDVSQLISHFSKYFHGNGNNQTKVFRCPMCLDFQTETKHEMLKHFENHSLDNPFKCETCGEGFPKFLSLYIHKSKLQHFVESDFEVSKKYNNPYLSNTSKVELFDDYDFDELQTMYIYKPNSSEPTIPELEEMLNPEGIHIYGDDDSSYVKQKKKSGPKLSKEVKSSGTQMDVEDFVYKGINDANVNNSVGDIQYEDDLLSVAQQLTHMAGIDNSGYTEVVVAANLQEETGNIVIQPGNTNAVTEPSKNYNTNVVIESSENYNTNVENNSLVTQTGQVSSGSSFGSTTAWNTDFIIKTQSPHDTTYQTYQIQYPKQEPAGDQEETDQIQYLVQESAAVEEVVNQIQYPQQQSAGVQEDVSYNNEPTEETVSATNALLQENSMKSILPSSLNIEDKKVPIVKNTQPITAAKPMVKQTYKVVDQSGNELIFCILNEAADSNDVYSILQNEANEPATVTQEAESALQEIIIDSLVGNEETEIGKKNDSVSVLTEIQSELKRNTEVTRSELNTNKQVVNIDTASKNNVLNAPSRNIIEAVQSQEQHKQDVETEVQEIFDKECFYMLEEAEQMKRNMKNFDDDEEDEEALNRKPKFMNKKNEDTGNYPCDICGKRFTKAKLRNYHRKVHLPDHERQFQCDQCGRGFNRPRHLATHKLVHSGIKHYGCDICGRKFTQLGHLTTHKITHREVKPFKCDLCDWTGATMSNLRKHILHKHETERNWKCDKCDRAYVTVGELKRHSVIHLSKKARSEIIAKTSEFASQDGDDDFEAKDTDGKGDLPNYVCDICGAGYRQKSSLNLHYIKHETGDDFKCKVCQKGFATDEILREHEKSHEESELPCDRCGKMLKTRSSLRYHIKSVHEKTAEMNYKCVKCQRGFHKQTHFLCHVAVCRSKIVEGTT